MCFIRDKDEGERPLLLSSNRKEVNSMEQSSSYDKETIRHQFDRKCIFHLSSALFPGIQST